MQKEFIVKKFLEHINSTVKENTQLCYLRECLKVTEFTKYHYNKSLLIVPLKELWFKLETKEGTFKINTSVSKIDDIKHDYCNLYQMNGEDIIDHFIKDDIIMTDSTVKERTEFKFDNDIKPNSILKLNAKTFIVKDLPKQSPYRLLKKVKGSLYDETNSEEAQYFGFPTGIDYVLSYRKNIINYTMIDKEGEYNLFKLGNFIKPLKKGEEQVYKIYKRIGIEDNTIEYIRSINPNIEVFYVLDLDLKHVDTIGKGNNSLFLLQINKNRYEILR